MLPTFYVSSVAFALKVSKIIVRVISNIDFEGQKLLLLLIIMACQPFYFTNVAEVQLVQTWVKAGYYPHMVQHSFKT